jgi:tetratricopeptide (TPR) repeat protein
VSGDLRASRKACTEGLELAERIGEGRLAIFQLSILAVAETDLGDPAALGHAEDAAERGRRIQQVVMRSSGVYPLARWLTAHGQAGDAVRLLEECLELGRDTDNRVHLVWVLPPYVEALLALARLEEAERAIGRGRALWREVGAQALEGIFARYEGERLVAAGRPDEALTCLDAAVARCEELDLRLELARSLRERATARRAGGDTAGAAADLGRAVELLAACGARPEEERARRELGAARPS